MSTTCLRVGGSMEKERTVSKGKRNMGKIKFLQLNAQHVKQARHEINRLGLRLRLRFIQSSITVQVTN